MMAIFFDLTTDDDGNEGREARCVCVYRKARSRGYTTVLVVETGERYERCRLTFVYLITSKVQVMVFGR